MQRIWATQNISLVERVDLKNYSLPKIKIKWDPRRWIFNVLPLVEKLCFRNSSSLLSASRFLQTLERTWIWKISCFFETIARNIWRQGFWINISFKANWGNDQAMRMIMDLFDYGITCLDQLSSFSKKWNQYIYLERLEYYSWFWCYESNLQIIKLIKLRFFSNQVDFAS